jgi:drug/metabolite transporter (DMT)-like permease
MPSPHKKNIYIGISLAILASLIWSGNFIIARGVYKQIPPISLAFYRWLTASVIIFPFGIKILKNQLPAIKQSKQYLFWASLMGVALFNTFVYIGGHYTTAINLALIGTTTSPVMAVIMAAIFLNERTGWMKLIGMIFCISGVLFLLSKGNFQNLLMLRFGTGDLWTIAAAFCFAVYNTLVKKKPASILRVNFLFIIFLLGTIMLFPFYLWEINHSPSVTWNLNLFFVILYLGLGTSVICFLIWNIAIHKIGTGRTVLFGNLIPIFSSIEAVIILHERFTVQHIISMILVAAGLLLANLRFSE